ncbi:hypothetical protein GCM10023189_40510 [Nibrella saemangeumensis]|uniref:M23ase beta-sheet core domain-containing protein n=1 Tax=Nibrella saemangeumensis TaxID=1084526 RepID=A0ABP8NBC2_9BACT
MFANYRLLFLLLGCCFPKNSQAQVIFSPKQREKPLIITRLDREAIEKQDGAVDTSRIVIHPLGQHTELYAQRIDQVLDSLELLERNLRQAVSEAQRLRKKDLLARYRSIPSILPIRLAFQREFRVSSPFGVRWHPITGQLQNHAGIDIPSPEGTNVYAAADGIVDKVVEQPGGLGIAVYIRHESGFQTIYGHLSKYSVKPGEWVNQGESIAEVGSTGRSTGPHLHYAVTQKGVALNPSDFCFLLLIKLKKMKSENASLTTSNRRPMASAKSTANRARK